MTEKLVVYTGRIVHHAGPANLLTQLLLWIALIGLILGLTASMQNLDAWPLAFIALAGILFGWLIGRSKLRGWSATIIILVVGILLNLLIVGRLVRPIGDLAGAEVAWIWQVLRLERLNLASLAGIDHTYVLDAWQGLGLTMQALLDRLINWYSSLLNSRPTYDPVAILMTWALLIWLIAAWAAWWMRHGARYHERVLIGLAPSGVLLAAYLAYSGKPIYPLAIWLGALLLLQALGEYSKLTYIWITKHIDKTELELEWSLAVVLLTVCLITFAVSAPSLSVKNLARAVRQVLTPVRQESDDVARAFGLKKPILGDSGPLAQARSAGLPNRHMLGSGPELSERVIMWVSLEQMTPLMSQEVNNLPGSSPGTYHWRSLTYDRYTGHGWVTVPGRQEQYRSGDSIENQLLPIDSKSYHAVLQHIQMAESRPGLSRVMYAAGELVSASVDYQVAWRSPGDVFGAEVKSDDYQVKSRLSRPGVEQLRSAGASYPEAIRQTYLQLPESIPRRVWELAFDLTSSQPSPYDQASAIESYLRTIPYSLDLELPPAERDIVDYFLFDLKRGYCDYYATAFVVLARAAGLPARLVVGYSSGNYQPGEERFVVTEADGHAWAEVYFPDYGWVEFEPTSGRALFELPESLVDSDESLDSGMISDNSEISVKPALRNIRWGLNAIAGALFLIIGWYVFDRLRLAWMAPANLILTLYRRLYHQASMLEEDISGSATPSEVAEKYGAHLQSVFSHDDMSIPLSNVRASITTLADLYAGMIYSPHSTIIEDKWIALENWQGYRSNYAKIRRKRFLQRIYSKIKIKHD